MNKKTKRMEMREEEEGNRVEGKKSGEKGN